MDDAKPPCEAAGHPFQGPHWHRPAPDPAADFVPLRLVLQPSGLAVDLTHPETVFGRHTSANIRLPLPDVSRRHCRFVFAGGRWQVIDLNSLNGTYVNGEPVQEAVLHHHDTVRIGGFEFQVDLPVTSQHTVAEGEPLAAEGVLRSIAEALPPATVETRPPLREAS